MKETNELDIACITKIIKYLKTLDTAFIQFEIKCSDDLRESDICQLAVTQIITNIYELKNKIQDNTLKRAIVFGSINLRAARNIASHDYDSLDFDIVYKRCMQLRNIQILKELEGICNDIRKNDQSY